MFGRLREEQGDGAFEKKVHLVSGDVTKDHLGLSDADKELLKERVNVVIHSAATVRFDEPLRYVHILWDTIYDQH